MPATKKKATARNSAKNRSVTSTPAHKRPVEALEVEDELTQGEAQISVEGPAEIKKPEVQAVDGPDAMAYVEEMAFMEERVTIEIAETEDANAENPVQVGINGRKVYIFRGIPSIVKRKYLERLARAKTDSFSQNLKETDPEKYNRMGKRTAFRYPFRVLEDANPKGRDWLHKVMHEG